MTVSTFYPAVVGKVTNIVQGGSGINLKQVVKLGVVAPLSFSLTINSNPANKRLPLEVLKQDPASSGVTRAVATFDAGDQDEFLDTDYVLFDGVMSLQTQYTRGYTDQGALGAGQHFSQPLDLTEFKTIEGLALV